MDHDDVPASNAGWRWSPSRTSGLGSDRPVLAAPGGVGVACVRDTEKGKRAAAGHRRRRPCAMSCLTPAASPRFQSAPGPRTQLRAAAPMIDLLINNAG